MVFDYERELWFWGFLFTLLNTKLQTKKLPSRWLECNEIVQISNHVHNRRAYRGTSGASFLPSYTRYHQLCNATRNQSAMDTKCINHVATIYTGEARTGNRTGMQQIGCGLHVHAWKMHNAVENRSHGTSEAFDSFGTTFVFARSVFLYTLVCKRDGQTKLYYGSIIYSYKHLRARLIRPYSCTLLPPPHSNAAYGFRVMKSTHKADMQNPGAAHRSIVSIMLLPLPALWFNLSQNKPVPGCTLRP